MPRETNLEDLLVENDRQRVDKDKQIAALREQLAELNREHLRISKAIQERNAKVASFGQGATAQGAIVEGRVGRA